MATSASEYYINNNDNYITEEDIKLIVSGHRANDANNIENYEVHSASNKMLGFLAEYLKVKVHLKNRQVLHFFIKAISRTNVAKAEMVREMKLFDKESLFYSKLKKSMEVTGIKPWSPRYITALNDAMVLDDLSAQQYKLYNKFERLDMNHTLQALKTLARFHGSCIIFEEHKKKETLGIYKITDDYTHVMDKGGYQISSEWYIQCMQGGLDAIKAFSKYNLSEIQLIQSLWHDIWTNALDINDSTQKQRNVICHRDLWNNNLMFHYKTGDEDALEPDDCLFIDFQAVRYQPPASDVMVLLCCNLDPKFREKHLQTFINFYYEELNKLLSTHNIAIDNVMPKEEFVNSAKEQTKWGLVVCACLMPQFWLDDDVTTTIFCDNVRFDEILCKNKGLFIKNMMEDDLDYRYKIMEIFEEMADRYCFNTIGEL